MFPIWGRGGDRQEEAPSSRRLMGRRVIPLVTNSAGGLNIRTTKAKVQLKRMTPPFLRPFLPAAPPQID